MKVVILAGGFGTRLSEETIVKPKPMLEIGGKPILWHIMKHYSSFGFHEFVICLGYKGYVIKEYFSNYFLHQSDITIDMKNNQTEIHDHNVEPWKITLVETGPNTMTGGRIKRVQKYLNNQPFFLTYGDGVSNVNISESLELFKQKDKDILMTVTQPEGRFGSVDVGSNGLVNSFMEKPKGDGAWINAGFFVCKPAVLDYIQGDATIFEQEPLVTMARNEQMTAYKHEGFWRPMDTLRDKNVLNDLWDSGKAEWKTW